MCVRRYSLTFRLVGGVVAAHVRDNHVIALVDEELDLCFPTH